MRACEFSSVQSPFSPGLISLLSVRTTWREKRIFDSYLECIMRQNKFLLGQNDCLVWSKMSQSPTSVLPVPKKYENNCDYPEQKIKKSHRRL